MKGMVDDMNKSFKTVFCALLLILFFNQVTYAKNEKVEPSKPSEGIESLYENSGSSDNVETESRTSIQSALLTDWSCKISNNQNMSLYLSGKQNANIFVDEMRLTLYLQRWDGQKWVDISSWTFYDYNTTSLAEDASSSFQSGNYYRTRAVHYAKYGSQTDTTQSTSSYIYIQ